METSSDRRLVSLETHNENFRIARTKFLSTLVPLKCNRGFAAHAFDLSSGKKGGAKRFPQADRRLRVSSIRCVPLKKPPGSDIASLENRTTPRKHGRGFDRRPASLATTSSS